MVHVERWSSSIIMFWKVFLAVSGLKLLFMPAYHSTDFEVHRNWMAITFSLPSSCWYTDKTSQWTLDYPPLFAWFELLLAKVARMMDPNMLNVSNLDYKSPETVLFQRLSVIVADVVFAFGVKEVGVAMSAVAGTSKKVRWRSRSGILAMALLTNGGLLMVDHVHFQYNGFLFGILLLSIARLTQGQVLWASFWFAVLLNLKHIFLYMAPAYFVFLLRHYCLSSEGVSPKVRLASVGRLFKLGFVVLAVFAASFGPFMEQIWVVLARLFPFQRGLCHAYWAPNFWALYNVVDKAATVAARHSGYNVSVSTASMTGGLVKEFSHTLLPSITPKMTLIFTVAAILPALWKLWRLPSSTTNFIRCLTLCAFGSFLFGWHVHEKAVLLMIIPMSLLAAQPGNSYDTASYILLSVAGHFAIHPLLFTPFEVVLKLLLLLSSSLLTWVLFPVRLSRPTFAYLLGLVPLFALDLFSPLLFPKLPFLTLMATSVYCAVGVVWSWARLYSMFLSQGNGLKKKEKLK